MAQSQNRQGYNNQDAEKDLLLPIYGGKSFVKIYQALEIGKIKFSFVNKENPKEEHIDCYIDADDFASDLIAIIDNDEIRKRAYNAKQQQKQQQQNNNQNSKYVDIWESRAGVSQANANQIRKFTIQPGTTQDYVFRATQNGKSPIVVGFAHRELKLLSYRWHFLEVDWNKKMAEKYCLANMTSEYHQKQNAEQYARQVAEEENQYTSTTQHQELSQQHSTSISCNSSYSNEIEETPTYGISSNLKDTRNSQNTQMQEPKQNVNNNNCSVKIQSYQLKVKTPLTDLSKGGKAFQGWGADNKVYDIIIRKNVLDKANAELENLMKQASRLGTKLTVKGAITDNNRIYVA